MTEIMAQMTGLVAILNEIIAGTVEAITVMTLINQDQPWIGFQPTPDQSSIYGILYALR